MVAGLLYARDILLIALLLKIQVFCEVTPSRLVNSYQSLEVRCLHLQSEVAQGQSTGRHIAEDFNYLQVSIPCVFCASILHLCLLNIIVYLIVQPNFILKKLIFRILMF